MKKILIALVLIALPFSVQAQQKNDDLPTALKPETMGKILDIGVEQSKNNLGDIADLYYQYMAVLRQYADKMIVVFNQYFDGDVGQAINGHHLVEIVGPNGQRSTQPSAVDNSVGRTQLKDHATGTVKIIN